MRKRITPIRNRPKPREIVEVVHPLKVAQMMRDGILDERTAKIEAMIADGTHPQYAGD